MASLRIAGIFLFMLLLLNYFAADLVAASPQQITFFENESCTGGRNESITAAARDDLNSTWIRNAQSFRVVGVWNVTIKPDDPSIGPDQFSAIFMDNTQPPDGECFNKTSRYFSFPGAIFYSFHSVQRIGPSELANSEITFYDDELFFGSDFVIKNDTEKLGNQPFQALLYILSSNDSWIVYPRENFQGTPMLITPNNTQNGDCNARPKDYFTVNYQTKITVGSIKKWSGCEEEEGENDGTGVSSRISYDPLITILIMIAFYVVMF